MTWYAIAISPSATRPARTVHLSRGPRNGLRTASRYSETKFQIERDLADCGFHSFVPADTLSIRDRKNGGYVLRRFPMLRGYAFILNPHDWASLEAVKGVCGLLGSGDVPIRIPDHEIASLSLAETNSRQLAEQAESMRSAKLKRLSRAMASKAFPKGMEVEIDHPTLGLQRATIQSATGRKTIKAMAHFLGGLVPVEIPLASVRLVA